MADITYTEQEKRLNFARVIDVFFHPRRTFQSIASQTTATWLTPLIILSLAVLINILVVGKFKNQAAMTGEITYPPDFQYYTPEQQAQYMQAAQSTQGPVFIYVLPAIASLLGVWLGWLILGGIVHLVTTLLGGRGSTILSMNIVAWASLPLALREIIQVIYILVSKRLIASPGLSGFSPAEARGLALFLSLLLGFIDIYLIWQILLIITGVRISTKLNSAKTTFGVVISVLIILILQTGLSYLVRSLAQLNITRPFFF